MSNFISNQAYNISTENELAEVLSHYNTEFVLSILEDTMKKRFVEVPIASVPNVVSAWNTNFQAIMAQYGMDSYSEVQRVREDTYREIINAICKEFSLNFTIDEDVDLYTAAFHLYDFLVSNFSNNLITFFANTIYKERSAYYNNLNMADLKKNKDSSTVYGKKVYKDVKLAVIIANIGDVIDVLCGTEVPFYNILNAVYGENSEIKKYIFSIVSAGSDFFTNYYAPLLSPNSQIRSDIITGIRFKLQEIIMAHDQIVDSNEINIVTPEETNNG